MENALRRKLISLAKENISKEDVSHDFGHALRVLSNAERIAKTEKCDLDILIPSALFHDLIVYQKNHPEKHKSQEESADKAEQILLDLPDFPKFKIGFVKQCILECSFSKGIIPKLIESKILQDADGLEVTGAISIMRTYSSSGQMKRPFYNREDPFCKKRKPVALNYGLDLFYERLLVVEKKMHTKTAKKIAKRRTKFLRIFLKEFELELKGN
jgi:uncharacterized protein